MAPNIFQGNKASRHQFCTVNPQPERFLEDEMVQSKDGADNE